MWDALATAVWMVAQGVVHFWQALVRWLRANTFSPPGLPPLWQHPLAGYVVAVVVQGLAVLLTLLLVIAIPGFPFPGVLVLLGIVLVALTYGAWPSLLATGLGAVLIDVIVIPRDFSWPLASFQNGVALAFLVGSGAIVSVVASRSEGARRAAESATHDRSTFLAIAAHELKTPVMVIQGSAHLLTRRFGRLSTAEPVVSDRDRLIAEARPVVARIEAGTERMDRLEQLAGK
jgi:signal transduction histidine kinase